MRWLVAMVAGILLQASAFAWPAAIWIPPLVVGAVIGATNLAIAELRRHATELRVAQDAVVEMARIAERERIGRDLHDLLGHTLSVIVLKSELAAKLADRDPARAAQEIRDVERISRDALAEVRKAVRGYRSERIRRRDRQRRARAGGGRHPPVLSVAPGALSPAEERALAYALREAVTNVVRHAERDALLDHA